MPNTREQPWTLLASVISGPGEPPPGDEPQPDDAPESEPFEEPREEEDYEDPERRPN